MMASGRFADRIVAFSRTQASGSIVVVVPRLTARLGAPPLGLVWEDTAVELPPAPKGWRDLLSGRVWSAAPAVPAAELFGELPVCVLVAGN